MMPHFKSIMWFALACLSIGGPRIYGDDWPLVRGDAFGTAVAHTTLANELEVIWKYPAGKDAGFDATPVISNGVIYIGDSAGTFHAVRMADGKQVWSKDFADSGF